MVYLASQPAIPLFKTFEDAVLTGHCKKESEKSNQ